MKSFESFLNEGAPLKDVASIVRKKIKEAGIKAKVRVAPGGGSVQVNAPAYNVMFADEEQREIRKIAKDLGLTSVRGLEIDVDRMTNPNTFEFFTPKG